MSAEFTFADKLTGMHTDSAVESMDARMLIEHKATKLKMMSRFVSSIMIEGASLDRVCDDDSIERFRR